MLFLYPSYDDWTNPFKLYPRTLLMSILKDTKATDFSLGFELALRWTKAGYLHLVVPHTWIERSVGTSKFQPRHALGFLRTLTRVVIGV